MQAYRLMIPPFRPLTQQLYTLGSGEICGTVGEVVVKVVTNFLTLQTGRLTDWLTGMQADRHTDRQTDLHPYMRCTGRHAGRDVHGRVPVAARQGARGAAVFTGGWFDWWFEWGGWVGAAGAQ